MKQKTKGKRLIHYNFLTGKSTKVKITSKTEKDLKIIPNTTGLIKVTKVI